MVELSESQRKIIEILKNENISPRDLAYELDLSYSGIRSRISELRRMGFNIDTIKNEFDDYVYTLSDDMEYYLSSKKNHLNDKIRNSVKDMMKSLTEIRSEVPKTKSNSAEYYPENESLVILNSDWHIGKKVEDEFGREIYNVDIAKKRIRNINDNIYKLANIVKRGTEIDEVVIVDVGDIIDGEQIYETQHAHLDEYLPKQIHIATKEKWKQIKSLRNKFDCPVRYLSVYGNHGGLGKIGFSEMSNFDNMVNLNLEILKDIEEDEMITIDNSYSEIAVRNIRGKRIFMKHKAPNQTETASARAIWGGWLINHKFDIAVTGHWHHYKISEFNRVPIIYNGSIVGSDDLSERMGVSSSISQMMFGVSDNHVPSFMYVVG